MKIAAALFRYFAFGGLQLDTMRFVTEFLKRGHRVTLFVGEVCSPIAEQPGLRVEVVPLRKRSNHARAAEFAQKFHALADGKFDVTLAMNRIPGCDFYFAADDCIVDEFLLKHSRLTIALLPRYRTFAGIEERIFRPGGRTRIWYIAERQKTAYIRRYGTEPERFFLLPPGIPEKYRGVRRDAAGTAAVRREFGIAPDEFLLIFVGSDFRRKGLDRAVRLLAALPEAERARTRLLAVGAGRPRQILPLIRKCGLTDRVVFTGGRSDTEKLLPAADLALLLSYSESAGGVIAESLACGTPVLCTANCGFSTLARDAGCEVVPEPWADETALTLFRRMRDDIGAYREKAEAYAARTDFFRRAAYAADLLEKGALRQTE